MTATLARLSPRPRIRFDHDALADLCAAQGTEAETYIAAVLTEIETRLTLVGRQTGPADRNGLRRTCDDLIALARTIGMVTVSDCATAVRDCIAADDGTALAACAARLSALGAPDALADWTVDGARARDHNDTVA